MKEFKAVFIAILPPIMSAIQIDGADGNSRIKLDVSGKFLPEILKLQTLTSARLKVEISEDKSKTTKEDTMEEFLKNGK